MIKLFKFIFVIILIAIVLDGGYCWRVFRRGRRKGGNLGAPAGDKHRFLKNNLPSDEWFTQTLDHFNPTDTRTWQQRYFTNDNFYNVSKGGPVFLMIGGEGTASPEWMVKGAWIDYAERFGALCFQLEHRYYGKSHPTNDLSVKNLQYLTSQQALMDLATFITAMNLKYELSPVKNKWIAFGGSYPGSLAAWLRYKYPHLVHGAMSASGPLLAKINFYEYFQVVDEALATYSDECVDAVRVGTSQIYTLLNHDMIGQRRLTEKFKLCDPMEQSARNPDDVSNFFETLSGNFADIVQYNKDNRFSQSKTSHITIETLCEIMTNKSLGIPLNRLVEVNNLMLNATEQKCLDFKYDKMIAENRNESWGSEMAEGGRQWTYQTCTEFGFFQTSSYTPQVFGKDFPAEFFEKQCVDIFGSKFNSSYMQKAVDRTNILYGALNLDVTNVVFVHGSIDPWHALGITKTVNQGAPAIYIKGTAHCANMYPASEKDLPELKAARVQIANYIDSWIRL